MSYVDRNSSGNHKALTGGMVALIQGCLVLALINGFAVTVFQADPPPRTGGVLIPLAPIPEPTELASTEPVEHELARSTVTAPAPRIPITSNNDITASSEPETQPAGALPGGEALIPDIAPPSPTPGPRFQPRGAQPRNDTAGWVTTLDYPTPELRAEHQGTVRFRLDVDARGRVSQCSIVTSSGYSGLDEATCKVVSRRARFDPATDGEGAKVAGTYLGTIRWIIPRD